MESICNGIKGIQVLIERSPNWKKPNGAYQGKYVVGTTTILVIEK
jgi:hypothetical protein